jgi:hypothetical protein
MFCGSLCRVRIELHIAASPIPRSQQLDISVLEQARNLEPRGQNWTGCLTRDLEAIDRPGDCSRRASFSLGLQNCTASVIFRGSGSLLVHALPGGEWLEA